MHICIRDSSRSRKSSSSKREQQRYGESDISAEQALMNDMCKLASTGLELPQAMASHRVVPTRFKFKIAPVSERPLPMVATKLRTAVPAPMHVAHFCVELHPPNIRRDDRNSAHPIGKQPQSDCAERTCRRTYVADCRRDHCSNDDRLQ